MARREGGSSSRDEHRGRDGRGRMREQARRRGRDRGRDRPREEDDEEEEEDVEVLEIPVRDRKGRETDRVVRIPVEDMPPADKVLRLLTQERAALHRWMSFAAAYFVQDRLDDFEHIMNVATSKDVEREYRDDPDGQVKLLNAKAAYLISQDTTVSGAVHESLSRQADALELLQRAQSLSARAPETYVNKGVLNFVQKRADLALGCFEDALEYDKNNLLALLGQGAVHWEAKRFGDAMLQYKKAIREHPGCGSYVRVNLGLCHYKLGRVDRAIECFKRALEIDDEDVNALVCLGIIELGQAQLKDADQHLVQRATERFRKVYDLQKTNAIALNHLASHFFRDEVNSLSENSATANGTQEESRVVNLVRQAYKSATIDEVRAEAVCILGRHYQFKTKYSEALECFTRARKLWKEYPLAMFGEMQMHLYRSEQRRSGKNDAKEREKAREQAFRLGEQILRLPNGKNDRDTKMILAWLHHRGKRRETALKVLQELTAHDPNDSQAWLEQARVLQKSDGTRQQDRKASIRAYTKASEGMKIEDIQPYVLNNIGELRFSTGDLRGALASFQKGLEISEEKMKDIEKITLRYNLALVKEQTGAFEEAEQLYKEIAKEVEGFTEPYLRRGAILERHGRYHEAEQIYLEATKTSTRSQDAWAMLGRLYTKQKDMKKAREAFEKIPTRSGPAGTKLYDPYARLSLANNALEQVLPRKTEKSDAFMKGLKYAEEWFGKILAGNPNCIFAANGIAMALAHKGYVQEARSLLEKLREPEDAANPSVWINLAHISVEEGRYETGVSLYQQCVKRFKMENDAELKLFLANALTLAEKYQEARSVLARAICLDPANLDLRYNMGTLLIEHGLNEIDSAVGRSLTKVQNARAGFKAAIEIFEWLSAFQQGLATASSKKDKDLFLQEPRSPRGSPPEENKKYFKMNWNGTMGEGENSLHPCRRPLSLRVAEGKKFHALIQAKSKLTIARKAYTESEKYVHHEMERERKVSMQLQLAQTRMLESKQAREAKEKALQEQKQAEKEKLKEIQEQSLRQQEEVIEKLREMRTKKRQRRTQQGTRKGGKRKREEMEIMDDSDPGDLGELEVDSSSDESDDGAEKKADSVSNGISDADDKKNKKLKRKKSDSDSSSSSEDEDDKNQPEEDQNGDVEMKKGEDETKIEEKGEKGVEAEKEQDVDDDKKQGEPAQPAPKKAKIIEDDEEEMDF